MIAVIADDLTGAAELGGLGLHYNLQVEIATAVDVNTVADLLIIAADTRSVGEEDAVNKIKQITSELLALQPQLIYKKIDSVLRGHVVAELKAQMEVMQIDTSLVIPANPHLNRTIVDGHYYVKGEPIHLTSFSNDPEFPVSSSLVTDMLRATDASVIKLQEALPARGIAVGEVSENNDLIAWAERISTETLLAGGSGFFVSILDKIAVRRDSLTDAKQVQFNEPMLFVAGTTFNKSRQAIREMKAAGGPVSYMPVQVIGSPCFESNAFEDWGNEISTLLSTQGKAIIAIEESETSEHANANDIREKMATVIDSVLKKVDVKELIVEGGSTAASIIRKLNYSKLIPVQELSAGVIRMKVAGLDHVHLTIKPGSYEWSKEIGTFFKS